MESQTTVRGKGRERGAEEWGEKRKTTTGREQNVTMLSGDWDLEWGTEGTTSLTHTNT